VRALYGLENLITQRNIDLMVKVMMTTGLIVAYGYLIEAFDAWISGNPFESYMMLNRFAGPYAPFFWLLITCNLVLPQLCWWQWVREHTWLLFVITLVINVGMWLERFIIVITSLSREFLPSSWGHYAPTLWDWATLLGSMGLFAFLLFSFIRLLPMISITEVNQLVHRRNEESARPA
jgi:molybdopterin-containing oxidoreductase family membrane subunit